MKQAEIKAIGDFLSDVYEGICEGDETTTMQQQLTELYRVIKRLMDLTSKAPEREKQFFANVSIARSLFAPDSILMIVL